MIWNWVLRFLFLFDAETVHKISFFLIRLGIRLGNVPLRIVSGNLSFRKAEPGPRIWGMEFSSRVGLAAGFDKNGEILVALPSLGFGFVELGTVTPRPQAGNPRPRLFRDPPRQALFNRMGFNGLGATLVSQHLAAAREKLPDTFRVGVNLGKNKDTPNEEAWKDYVRVARAFEGLADYLVINVSSPNTPGLRLLQTKEALMPIVGEMAHLISGWKVRPPLLLKMAPELSGSALREVVESMDAAGVDGWVLTNTFSGTLQTETHKLEGGWSGEPLRDLSRRALEEARKVTSKPIISVGGILSCEEAVYRRTAGADLIQIYSSWVYRGPLFPSALCRSLRN